MGVGLASAAGSNVGGGAASLAGVTGGGASLFVQENAVRASNRLKINLFTM